MKATALLQGEQRHTLIAGGARSGKTFLLTRAVVVRALRGSGSRHAILRFRANAVRSSIALDTLPKVVGACFPGLKLTEHRQDGFFSLPNESQIWLGGLDDKDRVEKILGQEFATIYFNECSQIPYSSVLVARTRLAQQVAGLRQRAYYDMNPSGTGHWTYHEFSEGRDPTSRKPLADPENYRRTFINPNDNSANLSPEFLASLANLPDKQRRRFYEGQYVAEVDGALWTYDLIERCRDEPPKGEAPAVTLARLGIARVVVAVDPSGATGEESSRSDEIGISVVGKAGDRAYVLADRTLRSGPEEWARAALKAFDDWDADSIVAEKNYGGGMVAAVIRTARQTLPVKLITASRGKHVRAEPVSALYEAGKVTHVGRFPDLEDQLVNFSTSGYAGERSPDRADALVWAVSDLMLGEPTYDTAALVSRYSVRR
ncbi:phage terminase large subunit [Methylobacterium sp. E-005]|uniref:phage terminase large subunit n=1 Tax=Methylobacterium sp. E-005 TaxID=2836549 RepID=UPI001FB8FA9B|nr:phage terminase large subunit [Methylobacterium sp. E-005]MCJ2084616.1 phage terminase large subunit [Methylobacterium sp. E-005]